MTDGILVGFVSDNLTIAVGIGVVSTEAFLICGVVAFIKYILFGGKHRYD